MNISFRIVLLLVLRLPCPTPLLWSRLMTGISLTLLVRLPRFLCLGPCWTPLAHTASLPRRTQPSPRPILRPAPLPRLRRPLSSQRLMGWQGLFRLLPSTLSHQRVLVVPRLLQCVAHPSRLLAGPLALQRLLVQLCLLPTRVACLPVLQVLSPLL